MKKLSAKLSLNRETLRNLEDSRLERVAAAGGPTEWTACKDCFTVISSCC